MPDQAAGRRLVGGCGCGWVEHFCCLSVVVAGFGTLLGPEETPVRCVLGAASGLGRLTHSVVGVVVCRCGFGVWLCVECCIVDASILLWSSVYGHMVDVWASGADEGRGRPR